MNRAQRRNNKKSLSQTSAVHPAALSGMLNDAIEYHRSGDLKRAVPLYNEVLIAQPNNHIALHMLSLMAYQIGNHDLALNYVNRALDFDPDNAAYHNTRSAVLLALDRIEEALASCREAVHHDPALAEAHYNLGNLLAQRGKVVEATACFQTAADLRPAYEAAWFRLGQLRLEQNQLEPALEAFRSPLTLNPDNTNALNNAGNILIRLGRMEEALESYRKAIGASPDQPEAHYNIGFVLHRRGDLDAAEDAYRRALKADPDFIPALNNLSELLIERGDVANAVSLLEESATKFPDHAALNFNLARALRATDQNERAEQVCRGILRLHPDHESTLHLLNTINGYTPEQVPAGYIRELFDNYAECYEHRFVTELAYNGPEELRHDMETQTSPEYRFHRVLDLGCGSGLVGTAFRIVSDHIDGVDLSPRMVETARRKNVYTSVIEDDLIAYLASTDNRYDLFIAADVLIYLGNLDRLFAQIADHADGEAWFTFTVESWDGDGFKLQPSGHIAHSDSYIGNLAERHGFAILSNRRINLRKEANNWIIGQAYVLRLRKGSPENSMISGQNTTVLSSSTAIHDTKELLSEAVACHRNGNLDRARELYDHIIEQTPNCSDAWHLLGVTSLQSGDPQAAVGAIDQAIAINPDRPEFHVNLGTALQAVGQNDSAEAAYWQAIRLSPNYANAHYNLANLLRNSQRPEEAIELYRRAIAVCPDFHEAYCNLGILQFDMERIDEAIASTQKAIHLQPNLTKAHCNLGNCYLALGENNLARAAFERALSIDPDNCVALINLSQVLLKLHEFEHSRTCIKKAITIEPQQARHHRLLGNTYIQEGHPDKAIAHYQQAVTMDPDNGFGRHILNALTGKNSATAPEDYVRELFDSFAYGFEKQLVGRLRYTVPEQLRHLIDQTAPDHHYKTALDLGCGTGLMGERLSDLVERLVGIDLSEKMIRQCQSKHLYHELLTGNIDTVNDRLSEKFDLIVAADVLVYLGDLRPLFESIAAVARPGAIFAFSTEKLESTDDDFHLRSSGRFAHSRQYIRKLTDDFGLSELDCLETTVRLEAGRELAGDLFVLAFPG
ncbi:MAG TPA: tetratricopeptide repeat protein [candidate division Zixibacteria bacterium]|nr:tetratricopeptide repeat protein [candidate division Zixibacteria bacterium]